MAKDKNARSLANQVMSQSNINTAKTNLITIRNLFNKSTATVNSAVYNTSGLLYTASGYYASDYISVIPGYSFIINKTHSLAYYDVNKQYVGGVAYNAGTVGTAITYTAPSNAYYVRISLLSSWLNTLQVEFSDLLNTLFKNILSVGFTYNYYLSVSGVTSVGNGNYGYASIPVKKGEIYEVTGTRQGFSILYQLKDVNQNTVTNYPTSASSTSPEITETVLLTIPVDGTLYINRYITNSIVKQFYKLNIDYLKSLVLNACCIGDSLTDGAYYGSPYDGASIKENYPYMLAKMSGWTVSKISQSGYSASDWWTNHSTTIFTTYDTVIICLGTNGGLTDTLDTDVVGEDYTQFANTNTGNYCKIIGKALADNPNCHIFLTHVYASTGDLNTTNRVIDKIAIKYNCGILDDVDLYGNAIYHPFGNAVHYGKVGNVRRAEIFYKGILNYINNSQELYEVLLDESL